jgi:acyl-ACP thioesterase
MKNWDGMGLEIGSSALDHNGNIDKTVSYEPALSPGDSITIPFRIKWLDAKHTENLAMVINDFKTR